ncbi:FixG Ig-like domain-containing protein, partial [Hydrogenophaga sp. 70-12]
GVAKGWNRAQMLRRALRPRVLVYSGVLLAVSLAVLGSLWLRTPLKVDVIRDRGALAREVEQGRVENVYRLQIMNATEVAQTYELRVEGLPGIALASGDRVEVAPAEVRAVAARVQVPPGVAASGSHPIQFEVRAAQDERVRVREKSTFLVPR